MKLPTKSKERAHCWDLWVTALGIYLITKSSYPWLAIILIVLHFALWLSWMHLDYLRDKLRKLRGEVYDLKDECMRKGRWP